MRKIACMFFPYFYTALARKACPELKKHPLAVYRGDKVIGVSPGLVSQALLGMPVARARGRCPEAVFVPYDHSAGEEAHERCLQILTGFSPVIEPLDEQESFIDLTGGSLARDMKLLKETLRGGGMGPCLVGIGMTKLVARLAARALFEKPGRVPVFQVIDVLPGLEKEFLSDISLDRDWYLNPRSLQRLSELGFTHFRDVQEIPREELVKILGRDGHILHRHCRGADDTRLIGLYPPQKLTCYFDFGGGTADLNSLKAALREGTAVLSGTLQKRRQGCRMVRIDLAGEQDRFQAERMIVGGCHDDRRLWEIARLLLEGLAIDGPVTGLILEVSSLYDWTFSEQDIFHMGKKSTRPERDLAEVAAVLQEKVPGMVFQGMKVDRREQVLALWDPWRS